MGSGQPIGQAATAAPSAEATASSAEAPASSAAVVVEAAACRLAAAAVQAAACTPSSLVGRSVRAACRLAVAAGGPAGTSFAASQAVRCRQLWWCQSDGCGGGLRRALTVFSSS